MCGVPAYPPLWDGLSLKLGGVGLRPGTKKYQPLTGYDLFIGIM